MRVAGHCSSPLLMKQPPLSSSVCFGLTSFGRWESVQFGLAKHQVFFALLLRGKIVVPKQGAAVNRNMLRDVGADDSLPTLDMENLPEPAPQPVADADTDADQHSTDETMEPREDAAEHALPSGDDVVKPVQGSRSSSSSSSSSSSCLDDIEELAGYLFPVPRNVGGCTLRYEDCEALRYRRFILQCNQHPKCTASRTISEQHTRHLGQYGLVTYLAVWARLGESVRTKSERQWGRAQESYVGVEPVRVASKQ